MQDRDRIKLHVPIDRRVEQRPCFFQVLTSDLAYLYACRFKSHAADVSVSGAVDSYRSSRDTEVTCAGVVWEGTDTGNPNKHSNLARTQMLNVTLRASHKASQNLRCDNRRCSLLAARIVTALHVESSWKRRNCNSTYIYPSIFISQLFKTAYGCSLEYAYTGYGSSAGVRIEVAWNLLEGEGRVVNTRTRNDGETGCMAFVAPAVSRKWSLFI
ncbi:hypothetical protein EVAR_18443_1 [Eumeta japonica]|uniref:Uncharacterized protein n=1 Tax=Eumeta variegata TaxID=151549 RepID=A0A4C1UZL7_EUMVA|nr:hypothetical protein EVAR_18443_1 [Eumeta japonica]